MLFLCRLISRKDHDQHHEPAEWENINVLMGHQPLYLFYNYQSQLYQTVQTFRGKKLKLVSLTSARTNMVLEHPGGPYRRRPFNGCSSGLSWCWWIIFWKLIIYYPKRRMNIHFIMYYPNKKYKYTFHFNYVWQKYPYL